MEIITIEKVTLFVVLIASLSVHEWAHAVSADLLGDPLPRSEGRVTLDPRAHIDLWGTIIIPIIMIFFNPGIAIIGWGKPVNISLPNHKSKERDDILITLAGPFSNVAIAFTVTFIFGLWGRIDGVSEASFDLLFLIVQLNCLLFFFNLIPIPPLDGSHILKRLIKMKEETYRNLSKYSIIILLVLVNVESFSFILFEFLNYSNTFFYYIFAKIAGT